MKRIVMATNNQGKIDELKKMLKDYEVISQKEANINIDPEENGMTFSENAEIKAKALKELLSEDIIIAEDSGIMIDALGGYPGTKTKRAAIEELGHEVTEEERYNLILAKMEKCNNRKITWQTAICSIDCEGVHVFVGEVNGLVHSKLEGKNGFGFDPIFFIPEENKTLAQMNFEEKSKYSARKRAVEKMLKYLNEKQ